MIHPIRSILKRIKRCLRLTRHLMLTCARAVWHFLEHRPRLVWVILVSISIIFYNFVWFGKYRIFIVPRPTNYLALSMGWIKISLIVAALGSGIVLVTFVGMVVTLVKEGQISTRLDKLARKKRAWGLSVGICTCLIVVILFLLSIPASVLLYCCSFVTLLVLVMDWLLEKHDIVWTVDFPIFIAVTLTVFLTTAYDLLISCENPDHDPWVLGFSAGAIAFQLIIGSASVNPLEYSWPKIFPPKITAKDDEA